jgi:hypothetical protein
VTEHTHLACFKGNQEITMIVRRRFADEEVAVERSLGYTVTERNCGDPICLSDDPDPRDRLLRPDYNPGFAKG